MRWKWIRWRKCVSAFPCYPVNLSIIDLLCFINVMLRVGLHQTDHFPNLSHMLSDQSWSVTFCCRYRCSAEWNMNRWGSWHCWRSSTKGLLLNSRKNKRYANRHQCATLSLHSSYCEWFDLKFSFCFCIVRLAVLFLLAAVTLQLSADTRHGMGRWKVR